jgi:threonine/homoserine efflux transporter RhtA
MMFGSVFVSPIGLRGAVHAVADPVALAAGIGVGLSSLVISYVFDQLAMARLPRSTYALFAALLPARKQSAAQCRWRRPGPPRLRPLRPRPARRR